LGLSDTSILEAACPSGRFHKVPEASREALLAKLKEITYTKDHVNSCRSKIEAQLAAYRVLTGAAREKAGDSSASAATFEPLFFNNLVLVLDRFFVHRARGLEGKDGNPLNEVRMLCDSILQTEWGCPPVACMTAAMVMPCFRWSIARTRACFESARRGLFDDSFLSDIVEILCWSGVLRRHHRSPARA
jgi:hypothetical protein